MKKFLLFTTVLIAISCNKTTGPQLPPVINLFAADSIQISPGASTTLRWEVIGDSSTRARIDPTPGNVPLVSSAIVAPTGTTTYTLVASNDSSASQRMLTIVVK